MTKQQRKTRELIIAGVEAAVAKALERHKKLGEPIAVWKNGRVVTLKPHQIPSSQTRRHR